jgi:hypothetical protein
MDNFTQVHESSSGVPRLDVLINSPHRLQVRHVHGGHKFAGHVRRAKNEVRANLVAGQRSLVGRVRAVGR